MFTVAYVIGLLRGYVHQDPLAPRTNLLRSAGRLFGAGFGGRRDECVFGGFCIALMLTSPITVVCVVRLRLMFCETVTPCVVVFAAHRVRVVRFDDLRVLTRDCVPLVEHNVEGICELSGGSKCKTICLSFPYTKRLLLPF